MKNKIEDILMHMESNHDDMGIAREEATKDITTLIQEEVEEFARTSTAYNKGKRALMKEAKEYLNE